MLSAAALAGFRSHVKNTVAYAKYKIGSTYYRSEITDITISSDGKVKIEFILNPSESGEVKVTEVQLYSTSGELWWSKAENITKKSKKVVQTQKVTTTVRTDILER